MNMPVVEISNLQNILNYSMVHENVNFSIARKEIFGLIGGSGSGKTTVLRNVLMLLTPTAGTVKVFGIDVDHCSENEAQAIRERWGVMFQQGALFSSLTVLENVMFPLREFAKLPKKICQELALMKLNMVGLDAKAAIKYPAELSGGMLKRAAAARAIALDPELLILDEPTSGLDPKSTEEFDFLILKLREMLNLTVLMVSHDVDSLSRLVDRAAFLGEGKTLAVDTLDTLKQSEQPIIKNYFSAYAEGRRKSMHTVPIVHPLRGVN